MGGSSVVNPLGHNFLGGGTAGRIGAGLTTGGLSEFTQSNPYGLPVNNPIASVFGNGSGATNPYVSGPFSLDPAQLGADQSNINAEGQKQYKQAQDFISSDTAARRASRQQLGDALTKQSADTFQNMLPGTLEDLNSRGLLNGSGVGQELARQQGQIAREITNQVGTLGANDVEHQSQLGQSALQGLQGFQTGGLQRGLSLEDFINQANVSKSLGQAFTPQAPSGKSQFGTAAQGVGALAPWGSVLTSGKGAKAAPAAAAGVI